PCSRAKKPSPTRRSTRSASASSRRWKRPPAAFCVADLPRLLGVETSFATLPEEGAIRRLPRAPNRPRAETFWRAFEDRVLWYDTFWDAEGQDILFVGPAARNLRPGLGAAAFTAQASGTPLKAEFFT